MYSITQTMVEILVKDWIFKLPTNILWKCATAHGLEPMLVAAICRVESNCRPYAARFEKGYRWLSTPEMHARELGITVETEEMLQSFSYGLMQIMGATARSMGFKDDLFKLANPKVNLEFGCRFLNLLSDKYGNTSDAVAAWNAGSPRVKKDGTYENQKYVDSIREALKDLGRGDIL